MKRNSTAKSGIFNPRFLAAFTLCSVGALLGMFSFAASPPNEMTRSVADLPAESSLVHKHPSSLSGNPAAAVASMPLAPTAAAGWAIVNSPDGPTTRDSYLFGVTCASVSDCWAVGYYASDPSGYSQTLIEHYDGTSWEIVASPNTSATQHNYLYGVACNSVSDCWAVGYYQGPTQTLIEHWDGISWTIVSSPNTSSTQENYLNGVTCASASECWAVGNYLSDSNGHQTLIEQWDGTQWSILPSPNYASCTGGQCGNFLQAVTCASASQCSVVGYYLDVFGAFTQTLAEQWDGTSWSIVPSANITFIGQETYNSLAGVTCTSTSECWAVGNGGDNQAENPQTLIEQWDGTSWSIVLSPNPGSGNNALTGVACASASDCWAMGLGDNVTTALQIFAHWDGSSWSVATSPQPLQDTSLSGIACASAPNCWAVGSYANSLGYHTLIETLTTSPVTITASASPSAGGTTSGGSTYVSGASVTVTATPNFGYVFTDWKENGSVVSTSSSYSFTATSNRALVAEFAHAVTVSLSSRPSAGGTTSGGGTYARGSSVTVTATANSGYVFTNWTQNGSVVSTSSSYTFTLNANRTLVANFNSLVPAISSIAPDSATAGGPSFTLTVNGSNFGSGSKVHWNSLVLTTTFVSSIQVTATVPSSDIRTAGTASVTVVSPPPGGGTSNAVTFTINNPVPAIGSISPSSATAGGPSFTLTVHGSNFVASSVVDWNGSARSTTFSSRTMLMASISSADIATAGTASVTVVNASPGGGTSNAKTFTINP